MACASHQPVCRDEASTATLRVVIPALDEAATLPGLFADLAGQRGLFFETVVVDGGSTDATAAVCAAHGVRCLVAPVGRATQMNAGAADFDGDWLLFLHADSRLSRPDLLARALRCLAAAKGECVGHFPLSFTIDGEAARGFLYRFMAQKTASGRRYTVNGDQGLLIRRATFAAFGGFDDGLSFLEDQRMMDTLHRHGVTAVCLAPSLVTSARRFVSEGPLRRYALMGLIMAMHVADCDSFFARARGVYARQDDTAELALLPFLRLAASLFVERGIAASAPALWRLAGVMLGETWQGALALDVAIGRAAQGSGPFTRAHDRFFAPVLALPVCRVVLFIALALAIFGPVWCMRLFPSPTAWPRMTP